MDSHAPVRASCRLADNLVLRETRTHRGVRVLSKVIAQNVHIFTYKSQKNTPYNFQQKLLR